MAGGRLRDIQSLTQGEINALQRGLEAVRRWVNNHPNPDGIVIFAGDEADCWSPRRILSKLEARINQERKIGYSDIPERILESISKAQ